MTRISFIPELCLIAMVTLLTRSAFSATVSNNDTETARLLKLEQVWMQAAQSRDTSVLKRLLSDDYLDINYRGILRDKADALRAPNVYVKQPSQKLSQEKVRIYGDTAVVTGRGQLNTGKQHYAWRFTDVFVKRNDQWRAVSSQETPEIRN